MSDPRVELVFLVAKSDADMALGRISGRVIRKVYALEGLLHGKNVPYYGSPVKTFMATGAGTALSRGVGLASTTAVSQSAGRLGSGVCSLVSLKGAVPTPGATLPRIVSFLAAPTISCVYHCEIVLCVLYDPKWHGSCPPRHADPGA